MANYQTYNYSLAAGEQVSIHTSGESVSCLKADAPFQIAIGNNNLTGFEAGLTYTAPRGAGFQKIEIKNTSKEVNKISLAIASGGITDSRLNVLDTEIKTITVPDTSITTSNVTLAANAATKVSDANAKRAELVLSNDSGNDTTLRIGGAGVTGATGMAWRDGVVLMLTWTTEVWAHNPTSSPITIGIVEVSK